MKESCPNSQDWAHMDTFLGQQIKARVLAYCYSHNRDLKEWGKERSRSFQLTVHHPLTTCHLSLVLFSTLQWRRDQRSESRILWETPSVKKDINFFKRIPLLEGESQTLPGEDNRQGQKGRREKSGKHSGHLFGTTSRTNIWCEISAHTSNGPRRHHGENVTRVFAVLVSLFLAGTWQDCISASCELRHGHVTCFRQNICEQMLQPSHLGESVKSQCTFFCHDKVLSTPSTRVLGWGLWRAKLPADAWWGCGMREKTRLLF